MTKSINREILKLAIPSILANITVPLVGMVDIAVAGHLAVEGSAALIGGIAVGTNLFDLLYWNFAFLRAGTGGLTAQAFGRGDYHRCTEMLIRGLIMALQISLVLIAIQWFFLKFAFLFIDCTPQVQTLAESYFKIRIWAAPATLGLMALKGWFIGMQDSLSSMVVDIVVNVVNIAGSIFLAMGIFGWSGLGFDGIASGTVLAQYSGLACALLLLHFRYRGMFNDITVHDLPVILKSTDRKAFAKMNTDLFVRSLCFIAIYIGYTVISAAYGDLMLASASIMMKLLMLFSYFTDGFAYAGEAMSGKYIGAGNREKLNATMRWVFVWSVSIALLFIGIYYVAGVPMLRVLSKDEAVIEACRQFLPWLVLMPLLGVIAFTWDGIYVGATATRYIRNTMIWSVAAFFLVWYLGKYILTSHGIATDENCIHMLLAAYFAHLLARSAYQTAIFRKAIVIP
ncbi:MAG: MATE family efflux transporter [Bacteroidaceae bacterium]|nr:MATE family efflux transporter [Bacteroidaceae bacterium]